MGATQTSVAAPSMGLKGLWSQVANLTAVAFVCACFWYTQQQLFRQGDEDRALYRAELAAQRQQQAEDSARQWHALQQLTRAVEKLQEHLKP